MFGKDAYAFDKILVGLPVAGNQIAHDRYNLERVEVVQALEGIALRMAELETHEDAARSQHAMSLAHHVGQIRAVADAERDRVHVVRVVRLGDELLGIADLPPNSVRIVQLNGALLAKTQHVGVDVAHGDFRLV